MKDLDDPVPHFEPWAFIKKGKIRIMLIFEDGAYKEYYRKLKDSYTFMIKKRRYMIVPNCVIQGKNPTFIYYFNNPMPLNLKWQGSKITAETLTEKQAFNKMSPSMQGTLTRTVLDADVINTAFTTNLINKMYQDTRITAKMVILILIVVGIITLLILHFTGVINLFEILTGKQ